MGYIRPMRGGPGGLPPGQVIENIAQVNLVRLGLLKYLGLAWGPYVFYVGPILRSVLYIQSFYVESFYIHAILRSVFLI